MIFIFYFFGAGAETCLIGYLCWSSFVMRIIFIYLSFLSCNRDICYLAGECRDTFSRPPCTLVQPSMQSVTKDLLHIPEFGIS